MMSSNDKIKLAIEKVLNKEDIYLCEKELKWEMRNSEPSNIIKEFNYAKICIVNHNEENICFSIYLIGIHYEYDALEEIMHSIEEEFDNNVLISFQIDPLAMIVRLK